MYNTSGRPKLTNCTFSRNWAGRDGGGMANWIDSSPTVTSCTFSGNSAGDDGGGMSNESFSSPTVTSCTFSRNTAGGYGGGMCNESSSPTVTSCTFSRNSARYAGGGMNNFWRSASTVTNSTFTGNSATDGGGISNRHESNTAIASCTFSGNSATDDGGGMFSSSDSVPTVNNCTFSGNSAGDSGGGTWGGPQGGIPVTNCILWGNSPGDAYNPCYPNFSITYSCVQGGYPGEGNIDVDPVFVRKPDDGGDGWGDDPGTPNVDESANDDYGDLHLQTRSPCIDAGTNDPPDGLASQDADGNPRPLDGNGDGQAVADIGAYESDPAAPLLAVSPRRVALFAPLGTLDSPSQTFSIRNCGGGTLNWAVDWEAPWVQIDPPKGESKGEVDIVTVTAEASELGYGEYRALLSISDPQAVNSPKTVEVVLYVRVSLRVPHEYPTIQAAIDATLAPGYEIVVADGVYVGPGNKDLDFHGKVIRLRSAGRDPASCVIDCEGDGRGFYFHSQETSDAIVEGFTICNGRAESGGGVFSEHSSPTLVNCVIAGNTALADGGGVYCEECRLALVGCMITGNEAEWNGGGVSCWKGIPTIANCAITGNEAECGGGVDCYYGSNATLTNCTITGNKAEWVGGGVSSYQSRPTLTNCTFSENSAEYGGGMYNTYYSNPTVTNCVLWGDAPDELGNTAASYPTVEYSCIQGGYTGEGNVEDAPLFVRDPHDGGDGWGDDPETPNVDESANDDYGDLHLRVGSPCIDTGDSAAVPPEVTTDLDGDPRIAWCNVDMGAYEHQGPFGDLNQDCDVHLDDFVNWFMCVTGPNSGPYVAGCEEFDFDRDGDVDVGDFASFMRQYTGPQ